MVIFYKTLWRLKCNDKDHIIIKSNLSFIHFFFFQVWTRNRFNILNRLYSLSLKILDELFIFFLRRVYHKNRYIESLVCRILKRKTNTLIACLDMYISKKYMKIIWIYDTYIFFFFLSHIKYLYLVAYYYSNKKRNRISFIVCRLITYILYKQIHTLA